MRETQGGKGEEGVDATVCWVPKKGHTAAEYEDAYAMSASPAFPFRTAVADGATETAFAGMWARLLAEGFVRDGPIEPDAFGDALSRWRRAWQETIDARSGGLPWYAAAKAESGAYAALVGLELRKDRTWSAVAVGDCCLFHRREERLLLAWPLNDPETFSSHPVLVPSRPDREVPPVDVRSGTWDPGDVFLLTSDALAAWLLQPETKRVDRDDPVALRARFLRARDRGTLRNDDLTLLVLRPSPPTR